MQPANEVLPLWYVTDEVGCKLRHSDNPNCRMVPFTTSQCVYSLLWPVRDVSKDGKYKGDSVSTLCCGLCVMSVKMVNTRETVCLHSVVASA